MIGLGAATTLGGGAMMLMMGPPQRPEEDNGYMAKYNSYLESTAGFEKQIANTIRLHR